MVLNFALNLLDIGRLFGPSLLSALVAFMLFRLTSLRDKKKEKKKQKVERNARVNYLAKLATMAKGACNHQLRLFESYAEEIKNAPLSSHSLIITEITSLERLFKITGDELSFKALTKLKMGDDSNASITFFTGLVVTIDYLYGLHQNIIEAVAKWHKENKSHRDVYTDIANNLMHDIVEFSIDLETPPILPIEKQFVDGTFKLQRELNNQTDRDIDTHCKVFIIPFLQLSYESISDSFPKLKQLTELIKTAENIRKQYEQIKDSSLDHAAFIEKSCVQFKSAIENLNEKNAELSTKLKI